jgi:hypothetical protein
MGTSSEKLGEQAAVSRTAAGLRIPVPGTTPGVVTPGATTGATTPAGDIEVPAQERARLVYDGMIKRGADHATAAGWAANALHESSANPNTGPGDRGASEGLFMWTGPRLQAYIAKNGHSPRGAPLDEQLDFIMHELETTEAPARAYLDRAAPEDKAAVISREFLRPKDREGEQQRRSATAQRLATLWGGGAQPGAPGGGRRQEASLNTGTRTDATTTAQQPQQQPPAQQPQQQTAATTPQQPAVAMPTPPTPLVGDTGLTAPQIREYNNRLDLARTPAQQAQVVAWKEQLIQHNDTVQRQYQNDVQQAQARQDTLAQRAETNARADAAAAALAEQRRVENQLAADRAERDRKFTGAPTGYQWNADNTELVRSKNFEGTDKDERLTYRLENGDPNSPQYASDYAAKKWQLTQNGSYIENDMSMYQPPKHAIQRPTYVPQPTSAALDKVREVAVDADVITQNIDRYLDVLKSTDGTTLSAFFNNPRDPKAQKLLGAFDAMRTSMRGPSAYNTGVLQPAEMGMLKEDLVSPQTVRGLGATPQAMEARLHEIKLSILRRADAELRSVGKDGVIMRNKKEADRLPPGAVFYDENGNKRQKPEAQ